MIDNEIIKQAILTSIEFDAIMDSIDFNSYLLETSDNLELQEKPFVKKSSKYISYHEMVRQASEKCERIIRLSQAEIKSRGDNSKNVENIDLNLIYDLFIAKQKRLSIRQQVDRKMEENFYLINVQTLLSRVGYIPIENYSNLTEVKSLFLNYNWAKVLYYNELAICYSGLAKSSMSLGYAEESVDILEKLFPDLKNFENLNLEKYKGLITNIEKSAINSSTFISLLTCAFYNKGEAERLLHKDDSALKTFRRIIKIYDISAEANIKIEPTDYNLSLLKIALIYIDKGRGKEAIEYLNKTKLKNNDYRFVEKELEKASAFIDQKFFNESWELLEKFTEKSWNHTFIQRKAKIYMLRLLNEFRENRPEDYQITNNILKPLELKACLKGININTSKKEISLNLTLSDKDKEDVLKIAQQEDKATIIKMWEKLHPDTGEPETLKNIKKMFQDYEKIARKIIEVSYERKDSDSFKDGCVKLAEFYQDFWKEADKSLKFYYLFLFNNEMFSKLINLNEIIKDWFGNKDLDELLQIYDSDFHLKKQLELIREDENYIYGFYKSYIERGRDFSRFTKEQQKRHLEMIEILKNQLEQIYYLKDKDKELEQLEISYDRFYDHFTEQTEANTIFEEESEAKEFVADAFFKNKLRGLHGETIVKNMERNTKEFIKYVVGKSKSSIEQNGKLQGTLTILRRWNSFTPVLSSSFNRSKGGGYFFHFVDNEESFGIVLDPGYNFLDNFFSQGFKIGDIDLVLVSHSHPDHTDNLGSILSLIHEMNGRLSEYRIKKKSNKKNPTLLVSPGVFENYNQIIKLNEKELKDTIVVDGGDEVFDFFNGRIKIKSFSTFHSDLSHNKSLGFIITVNDNKSRKTQIGYTGDIKWKFNKTNPPEYMKEFINCDIICVHLGSIINVLDNKNFCNTYCNDFPKLNPETCLRYVDCKKDKFERVVVTKKKLIEQARNENHLYLGGLILFFESLLKSNHSKFKLSIVSEFGEELKNGLRKDLFLKFNAWFQKFDNNQVCLPGDIGLEIDVFTGDVYCHCCKRFVKSSEIKPIPYGKEEAICFVCNECEEVLSTHQIDLMLQEYCENGRKLESFVLEKTED